MASPKIITFDESAHTAQLVSAGLDEQSAAELSAKIALLHAEGVALAQAKQGFVKAGVESAKAQQLAVATRRFKQAPAFEAPDVPPARTAGFKSLGDLFGTPDLSQTPARPGPTPESVDAMKAEPARRTPVKRTAKSAESKAPAVPSQPQRASVPAPKAVDAGKAKPANEKPAKRAGSSLKTRKIVPVYDYSTGEIPNKIRDLIDAHLAIEQEDAKSAGSLGFMTRSLAIATLPHKRYEGRVFERKNGDFNLTMMTAHPEGLPFGIVPRMLLTWVCTEAVQTGDRVLNLGSSLAGYLAQLGMHSSGGKRGDITRLKHAMTTLFSSVISCHYDGAEKWALSNVLLADRVEWWQPQNQDEAGSWQSRLQLSEPFFKECIEHPIPLDMRAMRALGQSPLALDIYVWITHRMSYLSRRTIIPWISLQGQFGSNYAADEQGMRDFKRAFLRELKQVLVVYPEAKVSDSASGLVMHPSPPHVPFDKKKPRQTKLTF
jgi:hypothetical protein